MKPMKPQTTQNDFLFKVESYLIRGVIFEGNKAPTGVFSKFWASSKDDNREDYQMNFSVFSEVNKPGANQ
jgi:hypothetical protein